MQVYLDESLGALYIDRNGGPLDVLHEAVGPGIVTSYALPADAVELHTADGAVSEVLGRVRHALSSVKMSATARREVEAALDDLEPGDAS